MAQRHGFQGATPTPKDRCLRRAKSGGRREVWRARVDLGEAGGDAGGVGYGGEEGVGPDAVTVGGGVVAVVAEGVGVGAEDGAGLCTEVDDGAAGGVDGADLGAG